MFKNLIVVLWALLPILGAFTSAAAQSRLTAGDIVQIALEANTQVRAARARWYSASHSVYQNYAPTDPTFSFLNSDSPTNGIGHASLHSLQLSQPLQFPGKGYLQAQNAKRAAEISRLAYQAIARDIRAQAKTAYYQILLDEALGDVAAENIASLQQVLHVTQVAYAGNRVTQADFISAEFALAAAQEQRRQLAIAAANDRTGLNAILNRTPEQPLVLERNLDLTGFEARLDELIALAARARQEILEAAVSERNSATALMLAKLEYAPDYTISYIFDHYLLTSAGPAPNRTEEHGFAIAFNVPMFFWLKQNEDVKRAGFELEAAREDLSSIRTQTAAQVTALFRQTQFSRHTALLYRDSLIPLARQGFEVALVAYQGGKVDFATLANTFRQQSDARTAYLQAVNHFLAGKIALEQAIGVPLLK